MKKMTTFFKKLARNLRARKVARNLRARKLRATCAQVLSNFLARTCAQGPCAFLARKFFLARKIFLARKFFLARNLRATFYVFFRFSCAQRFFLRASFWISLPLTQTRTQIKTLDQIFYQRQKVLKNPIDFFFV